MKPIARVHWIDKGVEKNQDVYTQTALRRLSSIIKAKNAVSWTCLLSIEESVPVNNTSRSAGTA